MSRKAAHNVSFAILSLQWWKIGADLFFIDTVFESLNGAGLIPAGGTNLFGVTTERASGIKLC